MPGHGGDDAFHPGGGADHLHGGAGIDTTHLPAEQGAYTFTITADGTPVARHGPDILHLRDIERVTFADRPDAVRRVADLLVPQ